ncbi:helix-turn-helix domain-containing protein [Paracoccus sp. (in: a-proteobacteria)]|uniref:helix-turn-helix domain-containing protein n=1 Tax=Paracoccus sp. TaxID=267 RepID=UPI003A88C8FC
MHKHLWDLLNRDVQVKCGTPSSVLPVFGENLRFLTSLRGTQARVAEDLGIGRVQFQRYLRGESFPKPNLLKKVCDYFGVDARILTEPLTEGLLREMLQAHRHGTQFAHRREWMAALGFAAPDQDYFNDFDALDDGLYATWQWSNTHQNRITRSLIRVFEQDGAKVVRGYVPRQYSADGACAKEREFRGLCLSLRKGYVFLMFHAKPSEMLSTSFVSPMYLSDRYPDVLVGFNALSRDELPSAPRLSRVVFERIRSDSTTLVRQAHMRPCYEPEDVPEAISHLLTTPVR